MPSMYAKLMSRITESSLMEEPVAVRYCFMMMLAIADPQGYVIGTDVAIARRMNLPVAEFKEYVQELMQPDPDSNSQEEDGRRVISSDSERGYFVVNYRKYRDTRDEEHRRQYMKEYMRDRRAEKAADKLAPVNSRKQRKPSLAKEEVEVKAEAKGEKEVPPASGVSERGLKFAEWFRTTLDPEAKLTPSWKEKWAKAFYDMIRLDGRTAEQIHAVCKWARSDPFWSTNFYTPLKLRDKKNDVSYFDQFVEKMQRSHEPQQQRTYGKPTPERIPDDAEW